MDATLLPTPRSTTVTSQRLADEITTLSACLYAATCRLLDLIREFDEGRHWEKLGMHSCAHWLNFKCGIGMNAAREKLRVAHALKHLPAMHAAFSRGELSFSKVRAMTRVANAANEDYLLQIAEHGTAYHVERLVSTFRHCKRLEDSAQAERQYAVREVTLRYDDDGSLMLKGRFPPEIGAMIVKALERSVKDAYRAASADDVTAETSEGTGRTPIAARRADALASLAESYLNTGPRSVSTADRYQVVVHVSAETLQSTDAATGPGVSAVTPCASCTDNETGVTAETHPWINADLCQLEDGPGVSAETSRRLACDASIVGIVDGEDGEPLNIGCERREDGTVEFTDRNGLPLDDYCNLAPLTDEAEVDRWLDALTFNLDIDKDTCKTRWYAGDRMDWDLGIAHMFQCEASGSAADGPGTRSGPGDSMRESR